MNKSLIHIVQIRLERCCSIKFNFKIQQYQTDAVDAVVNVFQGQQYSDKLGYLRDLGTKSNTGIVTLDEATDEDYASDLGYRNEDIALSDDDILRNIQQQQSFSKIKQSSKLVKDLGRCSLDIEMETGTGKTYVYIKTMFELNKRYGWSKFIVVVPSIAIREGVKNLLRLQLTILWNSMVKSSFLCL